MRKLAASLLCIAALWSAAAAQQDEDLSSPTLRIEWAEFKGLYDAEKIVVVDVRSEDAYSAGHIPRARLVPLADVEKRAPELKKLGKPIVLYCA